MTRRVCYISGTRADYGLMRETLREISHTDGLRLSIFVTGMHLDERYGLTVGEIEQDGFDIAARIPVDLSSTTGSGMARGIATMIGGFTAALERASPDIVLLLGDRGEMLAAAIAAIHLDIPIAHMHGGERSGTVDEPVRHAISKLSHYHFAATREACQRLIKMGERETNVFEIGAPGLVGLAQAATVNRATLAKSVGFDPDRPIALMVFHAVLQEAARAERDTETLLACLASRGVQTMALAPNADSGGADIRAVLEAQTDAIDGPLRLVTHLPRLDFISWMVAADVMIGNSSSGIIEAATFGTPVINVGSRQNLRERNANVVDVAHDAAIIDTAIDAALEHGRYPSINVYGDGLTAARVAALLKKISLDDIAISKFNAY